MTESRADRHRREHAEAISRVRAVTARPPAPRRTRLLLATAYVTVVGTVVVAPFVTGERWATPVQVALLLVLVGVWSGLRRATRLVTEAPDEGLDELHVRLRNAIYLDAFRLLGAVAMLVGVALTVVASAGGLGPPAAAGLGWGLLALTPGLPALVAAVRLPDDDAVP